jgi:hypothetical protein
MIKTDIRVNLSYDKNPKQAEYFVTAMSAAQNANPYKFLSYGGAIRGGKTFVTLAILIRLCEIFPNSRWHIIRKDFPVLEKTTIPSIEKILTGSRRWRAVRKSGNYHYQNLKTNSKIFFSSENINSDKNLNWMLGLETNGFFLEQAEELSEKIWEKSIERVGSWYLPKMPRGLIFLTFNPTQRWVKEKIYDKWLSGELPPEYFFQSALPKDNPFVTQDQYDGWDLMAERYRKQFVEGDWTDFDGEDGRWLFAFSEKKHVGKVEWNKKEPLYISFDFNRNPIVCSAWQHYGRMIRGIRTIKLKDSTIHRLCQEIEAFFPNALFFVTGDASGAVPTTMSNMHNFDVIKNYFRLGSNQMNVSRSNPRLEDSRVFCNSILEQYGFVVDKDNCKDFIFDAKNVKADPANKIVKESRKDEAQQADTLDTFRYYLHRYFADYLKLLRI